MPVSIAHRLRVHLPVFVATTHTPILRNQTVLTGLTKICQDAGTVRQRRKMLGLAPTQFYDAGTDAWTVRQGESWPTT